jgi:hypothetical protein
MTDLHQEEDRLREEEDAGLEIKRQAAVELARMRGLSISQGRTAELKGDGTDVVPELLTTSMHIDADEVYPEEVEQVIISTSTVETPGMAAKPSLESLTKAPQDAFVPARLPHF